MSRRQLPATPHAGLGSLPDRTEPITGGTVASNDPIAREPDGGDDIWFFGTPTSIRVGADEHDRDVSVVQMLIPGNYETPLHRQVEDFETFHVLAGEIEFISDKERFVATEGATVHVPAGVPHGFRVLSDGAEILDITTAQHESFFREAGVPAERRELPPPAEPDLDALMPIAERHRVEIMGPLPS